MVVDVLTFYETLKIAMELRGVKAADLCRKTGIHSSYFSKLKKGKIKDATWDKAVEIITALEMTPSEFYELSVSADK